MSAPAPAILALLDQINAQWPARSKASDGILGDASHQQRASDHNQGDAIDVTLDAEHGPDLDALAEALILDPRTHYVIFNKRIRNRAFEGGAWRPYSGASPHTHHLHLSIHPDKRDDTAPWRLSAEDAAESSGEEGPGGAARVAVLLGVFGVMAAGGLLLRRAKALRPGCPLRCDVPTSRGERA